MVLRDDDRALKTKIRAWFDMQRNGNSAVVLEALNALCLSGMELSGYDSVIIAECCRDLGDFSSAIKHFRFALQTCPRRLRPSVFARIGYLFKQMGRLTSATRWFNRTLVCTSARDKWWSFAQFNLADICIMKCDLPSAEQAIIASISSDQSTADAWVLASKLFIAQRKLAIAASCLEDGLERFPDSSILQEMHMGLLSAIELRASIERGEEAGAAIEVALNG